ncbi:hypothetical protein BH23ACT10_BH23ACT10_20740 [soil metagenome]
MKENDDRRILSVAMTGSIASRLRDHLIADPAQEHVCMATYAISTGARRTTYLLDELVLPGDGDVELHGNATIHGDFVMRGADRAADRGRGLALLHSHPTASGWQAMSPWDAEAERDYANLAREVTDLPLLGLTMAGDGALSARAWDRGVGRDVRSTDVESVRIVDPNIDVTYHPDLRPVPAVQNTQFRTVTAWGAEVQGVLSRLRVLVVGVGSVGLDVALRLAASGVGHLGQMDPDIVTYINRDRMIGATADDARSGTPKVEVARRQAMLAATSAAPTVEPHRLSVCTPEGLATALDYDVIFSCVDRPWPRSVLNQLAYTDLIPVIDGGIGIDVFDTSRMRQATWRAQVVRPGRRCLTCTGQLKPALVSADKEGLLDDPEYIRTLDASDVPGAPNTALLSASVSAMQLAQFVSYFAAPGGETDGGPLRYSLSDHHLDRVNLHDGHCDIEHTMLAVGDERYALL